MNKEIEHDVEFILYLTFPQYYYTKCHLPKAGAGRVEITWVLDNTLIGPMIREQQV